MKIEKLITSLKRSQKVMLMCKIWLMYLQ